MSKSKNRSFDLYQLGFQTSINCWQAASARIAFFATRPPFDSRLIEESTKMINEKMTLSIELSEISSSRYDPQENYRRILETINQKAVANVNRLKDSEDNA